MRQLDRFLIGALVVGVWSLVALQMTSSTYAQELSAGEQVTQNEVTVIHATDIVGLSAMTLHVLSLPTWETSSLLLNYISALFSVYWRQGP